MPIDHERIRENGWRQGRVFSLDDTATITEQVGTTSRLIVVSHDCDIVHTGDHEPHIELCLAEHLPEGANGLYRWARHPRRLDLEIAIDDARIGFRLNASDKQLHNRAVLEAYRPDDSALLPEVELTRMIVWLAKRYNRVALPDAFNLRRAAAEDRVRGILRRDGEFLSGLFIALKPRGEQDEEERYEIHLVGLMRRDNYENIEQRTRIELAINQVGAALDACVGIDVVEAEVQSEATFTLHDLYYFIELTFDDLSLRVDPPEPRLPAR